MLLLLQITGLPQLRVDICGKNAYNADNVQLDRMAMSSVLEMLSAQRDAAVQQIAELRAKLKDFDVAIAALENKQPVAKKVVQRQEGHMTLKDAVLLAVSDGEYTTDEVYELVVSLGYPTTTRPSIASTLSRLKADDAIIKTINDKWTKAPEVGAFEKDGAQGGDTPTASKTEDANDIFK